MEARWNSRSQVEKTSGEAFLKPQQEHSQAF